MSTSPSESRRQKAARRAGEFPGAPEPLAVPVFDSHTHLDLTISEAGRPGRQSGTAGLRQPDNVASYLIRRVIGALLMLVVVSMVTFAIFFLVPRWAGGTAANLAARYVGRTSLPMAQTNPASSRATAVTATVSRFPRAESDR